MDPFQNLQNLVSNVPIIQSIVGAAINFLQEIVSQPQPGHMSNNQTLSEQHTAHPDCSTVTQDSQVVYVQHPANITEHRSINQTLSVQHTAHSEYSNTQANTLIRQHMSLFNQSFIQTPELTESISRACESSLNQSAIIYTEEIDFSKSFTAELKLRYSGEYTDDMLSDLLVKGYSVPKIAKLLGLEPWKIKYNMRKAGLRSRQFSELSNLELDCIVRDLIRMFPNSGFKNFVGQYKISGPRVSRNRLRESFCRVKELRRDPPRRTIKRRVYSVKGPLSLWHVDSHHKLSRWKFYVQGCVDGFSRLMVVLNLSSNNRAETTLNLFLGAVAKWGLPLRVRSDHGTENYGVCDFMLVARSEICNPFIAGKSVHNQRVERSWRDVFETALEPFHIMFYSWEANGHLNPSRMIDLVSLHITCRPLLIRTVDCFAQGWNNHPLSTEHNETPERLFHGKLIELLREAGDDCDLLQQDVRKMEEALRQLPTYPTDECSIDDFLTQEEMRNLNFDASLVTLENAFAMYMYVRKAVENVISFR